jgi:uncharacterized protein
MKAVLDTAEIIKLFGMQPHPEGGYYKESYRSTEMIPQTVLPKAFSGDRCFSTAIYFLLPKGAKSRLHRIASDEIWHFYLGGPLTLTQLMPDGNLQSLTLGPDIMGGQQLQHVVPAGCWFGAQPQPGSRFSLVGCTLAPGFDFADFELGDPQALMADYPHAKNIIEDLAT